jgi:hypothetical protein
LSNPSGALFAALMAALEADAGVVAAFGLSPVQIYRLPPVHAPCPFIALPGAHVLGFEADGLDGADATVQVDVWSRTDPPGFDEAEALCTAVGDALAGAELLLSYWRVIQILPIDTRILLDRDGQTVHGVVTLEISADPA